jgi:hypothetical protein
VDVEKRFELRGDILEERENAVVRMLIPEGVKDKTVFGNERVAVGGNPFSCSRFNTPRKK